MKIFSGFYEISGLLLAPRKLWSWNYFPDTNISRDWPRGPQLWIFIDVIPESPATFLDSKISLKDS